MALNNIQAELAAFGDRYGKLGFVVSVLIIILLK
jgi:hypothetical protein